MPEGSMDGIGRADVRRRWPSIDLIITSGKSHPKPNQMRVGSAFLSKPYRLSDVIQTVRDFR